MDVFVDIIFKYAADEMTVIITHIDIDVALSDVCAASCQGGHACTPLWRLPRRVTTACKHPR